MPLQHQQLLSLPASGVVMGLLTALPYTAALGWPMALSLGVLLAAALGWLAAWLAWRSDHAARHGVANAVLFSVFLAPLLGGMNLLLMHMLGKPAWAWPAWAVGALTTLVPMAFAAVHARGRLLAQGASGPWARQHIDVKRGMLRAGALAVQGEDRLRLAPWLVGALAVNALMAWRAQGGSDVQLMPWAVAVLALGVVWAGVAQVGPSLGKALFVQSIERQVGQRLNHEHWADIQAVRAGHWLARRFMVKS
jgi:hypothetical protein